MTFLNQIVSLVQSMRPMWEYSFNYIFALAFLATVPYMIDSIFRR